MNPELDQAIAAALQQVCDPCSIAANAPVSILDMGLILGWEVDDEMNLVVRMCITSPSCTMGPHMVRGAESLLARIPGLRSARVDIDPAVFWTPDRMTPFGQDTLSMRRSASVERAGARPQQWRTAGTSEKGAAD